MELEASWNGLSDRFSCSRIPANCFVPEKEFKCRSAWRGRFIVEVYKPASRCVRLISTPMSSQPPSLRRVVSADNGQARVVVNLEGIQSTPSLFRDFHDVTFVDKTLLIEAFLRHGMACHLILRPRGCGKTMTLSMIRSDYFLIRYFCTC